MDGQDEQTSQGHPAWNEILNVLPPEFQEVVKPRLADMEKNFQQKLQDVTTRFSPFKEFAENEVDPEVIKQSLFLANHLQTNPKEFVERAIGNFNLSDEFIRKAEAQLEQELSAGWEDDPDFNDNNNPQDDDMNNPLIQELLEKVGKLTEAQQKEQEQAEQDRAYAEHQTYLKSLEEEHGEFDHNYVTALIANGADGPQAIAQYNEHVNAILAKAGVNQPPVAQQEVTGGSGFTPMGGGGVAGSGTPNEAPDLGSLSNGQTMDLVAQMLAKAQQD